MFATTPEGYAVCDANIPVGASVSVGTFDSAKMLETSKSTIAAALNGAQNGMLIFSCISRYYAQGRDSVAELKLLDEEINSRCNYLASYSGGEICPGSDQDGKPKNFAHRDSIIICVF